MNRILLIDDDKELCALIKKSVLQENIETDCCYRGKEGLIKLRDHKYQLVILDISMPELDGFEILERIRERYNLPVLTFLRAELSQRGFHIDYSDHVFIGNYRQSASISKR